MPPFVVRSLHLNVTRIKQGDCQGPLISLSETEVKDVSLNKDKVVNVDN